VWKIDELEDGESVRAVAPILEGGDFTHRLMLTDRRIMTIRSPVLASMFGCARFAKSCVIDSTPLEEVTSAYFTSSFGGFSSSLVIKARKGTQVHSATGIGSRWLRLLASQLPKATPRHLRGSETPD
jgi:hypothetical protein